MSTPISGENQAKLVGIGGRKRSNDKGLQQTDVNAGKELQKTQSTVISNPNELMGKITQLASAIKYENNTFDSSETKHCKYFVKGNVDSILDWVEAGNSAVNA
jgi:hypothetical protein